ncbi:hypothetical protein [Nocardia rhizosphaerae]|uniref:Integral membrane protein n=1 Tax=Nocardia rhizosphaerae TaxID=1691571 RepID=A0ABV8L9P4_9NOCA
MAYFDEMSRSRQGWESVGGAVVAGMLTGLLLGVNVWAYTAATVVSVAGGIPAGSQHRTLGGAVLRGCTGGLTWSAALLFAHELAGRPATAALPEPQVAFLPYCFLPTALAAAIVWLVANRRRASTETGGVVERPVPADRPVSP